MNPNHSIQGIECSNMMSACRGPIVIVCDAEPAASFSFELPNVLSEDTIESAMNPKGSIEGIPYPNMATATRHGSI